MLINHDFTRRVTLPSDEDFWVPSSQTGVDRVILDFLDAKPLCITSSIVRYLPKTSFSLHFQPACEEVLVLAGQFSTGEQVYQTGYYLRNSFSSCERLYSESGTLLFVKIGQMIEDDNTGVCINTCKPEYWFGRDEHKVCPLFSSIHESIYLLKLQIDEFLFEQPLQRRVEIFIVEGILIEGNNIHERGGWIKIPAGKCMLFMAAEENTVLYFKKVISD